MKGFNHISARTVEEAAGLLKSSNGKASVIAGGTDLLGILKDRVLPDYPEIVIDLKTIPDLDYIEEDEKGLKIGALAKLSHMTLNPVIKEGYGVLAQAAQAVASPQIRNLGTIGGNLCQDVRCLYYRYPHQIGGRILCKRKGSGPCFAVKGDNRYSAIMDGKGCFAVCPSDMAIALTALNADIKATGSDGSRIIPIRDFYTTLGNVRKRDEIITECRLRRPSKDERSVFLKFRQRDAIDFAIVSVASSITVSEGLCQEARIVLGAVASVPVRATAAEAFLKGKALSEKVAEQAAGMAVERAKPLSMNAYKIQIAKELVRQSIMALRS